MTVEEFFGTLQCAVTKAWRDHLKTNKYSVHMALNEFYDELPEKVDSLIEAWQADHDVINDYKCVISQELNTIEFLKALKELTVRGRELMEGRTELESLVDDISAQIDATLYKITKLNEGNLSLRDYLML